MTMRTAYSLTCFCGHKGAIRMRENDQPYSKPWEGYSLDNLDGNCFNINGSACWVDFIEAMKPSCPQSKKKLTQENFDENY